MFGQAHAAVEMPARLLRYGHFYRVDYSVPPRSFTMDNATCAKDLIAIGRQIAREYDYIENIKKTLFLNGSCVEPYRPLKPRSERVGTGLS
jgi:hypothetical protein